VKYMVVALCMDSVRRPTT